MIRAHSRHCDKKLARGFFQSSLAIFLSLLALLMFWDNLPAKGPQKELPMLVSVSDLAAQPGQYDGHRVVVTGRVLSMEMQIGRRGSEYLMLVLEEDASTSSEKVKPVQVYSPTVPKVQQGDRALVQGVYHIEGKQAGRFFEHFVDAEVILRN